jgi:F420-dependent oxidoreductase-like protein
MDIGIFTTRPTVTELTDAARQAADQGFASFWVPQIFGLDALTAIAVAGSQVPNIAFGTAVVPTYPRHPQMLAQQALTVNQVLDGRLLLGVGPSHQPVVEGMWGLSFDKPIRHLREYLEILVPLLEDGTVRFSGEALTTRADLDVRATPPPVFMAALGPQLLKVTGRLANGTVLWMTGPKTIAEHTIPTLAEAAAEAGRPAPKVIAGFPICVTSGAEAENQAAKQQAAAEFAIYGHLPSYRAMLDREGATGPEDVAFIGSAAEISERIHGLAEAGVTTFTASEFGSEAQLDATRQLLVGLATDSAMTRG